MIHSASCFDDIVEAECSLWEGTRYRIARKRCGVSVDCVHFVAGVLDGLFGTDNSHTLNSLMPDACVHNRLGVMSMARMWFRIYPHDRVRDSSVEAGDVVLFRPVAAKATASHIAIAGAPGKLWHATPPKVSVTSFEAIEGLVPLAVYRSPNKRVWLC